MIESVKIGSDPRLMATVSILFVLAVESTEAWLQITLA